MKHLDFKNMMACGIFILAFLTFNYLICRSLNTEKPLGTPLTHVLQTGARCAIRLYSINQIKLRLLNLSILKYTPPKIL